MELEIIKEIDTSEYRWCTSAVLTKVSGGRGTLTSVWTDNDIYDTFYNRAMLTLNGEPLIQGEYPMCGTCEAMLARGYGIEKTNTPELSEIRDKINAPFTDLKTAAENITPVLGLLDDGYYVIADASLYPTDGEDHFFTNIVDKLHPMSAATNYYFSDDFCGGTDAYPAYIYPTQSNSCLNIDRAKQYLDVIDRENSPRAIAYYHYGFLCALLDGHHKAYAAAMKGVQLKTLVIVPVTAYHSSRIELHKSKIDRACFADIVLPLDEKLKYRPFKPFLKEKPSFEEYSNSPVSESGLSLRFYPTVEELSNFLADELDKTEVTSDLVDKWLESDDIDDRYHLKYALGYFSKTDHDKAMLIAKKVIKSEIAESYLQEMAMRFLVRNKSDEAEKLVIDYLIEHEPDSKDPVYK